MVKRFLSGISAVIFCVSMLSSCNEHRMANKEGAINDRDVKSSYSQDDYIDNTRRQSETMVSCIANADVEGFASLFCPYMIENTDGLEEQIVAFFDFVDGEIISYDAPVISKGSSETTELKGYIRLSVSSEVNNIVTDTGKTYVISHGAYSVYDDKPEYVGITDVIIYDKDLYTQENGYPKSAMYEIYDPVMWEY